MSKWSKSTGSQVLALTAGLLLALPLHAEPSEDISNGSAKVIHQGSGEFAVHTSSSEGEPDSGNSFQKVNLRQVVHGYDPEIDTDVPLHTNVTLNDRVGPQVDKSGREYALITLYQVDPPLADLPSREAGIDRGIDMRTPADMVKSTYSNYVSPVFTGDAEQRPVPNHPIGHFFVKVEISGYPTILTGMTTIKRADEELVDLTLGQSLGVGGVLLIPQPGRLNSAEEAVDELGLRQRRLRVIDGRFYKQGPRGVNVGPEYVIEDGNVVFARFKVPSKNAKDALAMFVEFVAREQHKIFGSLINRPHKGTGAGCTPFAMAWLKASGVIPFVAEPEIALRVDDMTGSPTELSDLWPFLLRSAHIPWADIGCDRRLGIDKAMPAKYTAYDHLFHNENKSDLRSALPGLAEKIRRDRGTVVSTLFAFGALTPLRDLIVASKRKDSNDVGDYKWASDGKGFNAQFWDNARFSRWVKQLSQSGRAPEGIELEREGRFLGVSVDTMNVSRQKEPFFSEADRIKASIERLGHRLSKSASCQDLFSYRVQ
jgi:hypothetical protein